MSSEYYLYYDFLNDSFDFWFGFSGISLSILGTVVFFWQARLAPRTEESERKKTFYLLAFVASCIMVGFIWTELVSYSNYSDLRQTLIANRVNTVEGEIRNFVPMPGGGHAMEKFSVEDQHFQYSEYAISPGFRRTVVKGGSILRNGMKVRIKYLGNHILRLEIRKESDS